MSPTFMLGIWHSGEWLKRDLVSHYTVEWNVEVPSWVWILYHQYEDTYPYISMSIILVYMWIIWLLFNWYLNYC